MPLLTRRGQLYPVFAPAPINWAHRLNDGLASWWRVMRPLDGGAFWYNLAGLNHGTLTAMTAAAWNVGSPCPGSDGHLVLDGTDDKIVVADSPRVAIDTTMTFIGSYFQSSAATLKCLAAKWTYATDASWSLEVSAVNTSLDGFVASSAIDSGGNLGTTPVSSWSAGAWHRVAMVIDGAGAGNSTRLMIYIDGIAQALTFIGTIPSNFRAGAAPLNIGQWGGSLTRPFNGYVDDVRQYGRALSAAEVYEEYLLSKLGHPGELNRWAPWAEPAVAAASGLARIIGGGFFGGAAEVGG